MHFIHYKNQHMTILKDKKVKERLRALEGYKY